MFETKNGSNKIGLGGWLSVWLILTCLGIIRLIFDIDPNMLSGDGWNALTNHESKFYHPLWCFLLFYEFVLQFLTPIAMVCLIFLYARKSHFFPKSVIVFYVANFVLVLLDTIATRVIGQSVDLQTELHLKEIIRGLIAICIWTPYFLKSERVKATFIK
jgi:hypothetical protein